MEREHRITASRPGQCVVKQMIMGAGKTSVVSPLICLMLAQGEYLVLQCVPPALLPMSSSVLRTTFSSAIQKRVYTFSCDRATKGKKEIQTKLESAQNAGAVVITTPPAIKSLMLKFVENLSTLTDRDAQRHADEQLRLETEVTSDGFGWLRMASDGFGWLRRASDGFGGLRMASDGFGWLWMASGGFGWHWMASDGS